MRWLVSVLGVIVIVLGVYWSISPPLAGVDRLFLGGTVFLIGLMLLVAGYWWHRRSKMPQTVTIALGDEAEQDAAGVEQIETAVRHHINPDDLLPKQKKKADDSKFIQLPKEEQRLRRIRR